MWKKNEKEISSSHVRNKNKALQGGGGIRQRAAKRSCSVPGLWVRNQEYYLLGIRSDSGFG